MLLLWKVFIFQKASLQVLQKNWESLKTPYLSLEITEDWDSSFESRPSTYLWSVLHEQSIWDDCLEIGEKPVYLTTLLLESGVWRWGPSTVRGCSSCLKGKTNQQSVAAAIKSCKLNMDFSIHYSLQMYCTSALHIESTNTLFDLLGPMKSNFPLAEYNKIGGKCLLTHCWGQLGRRSVDLIISQNFVSPPFLTIFPPTHA